MSIEEVVALLPVPRSEMVSIDALAWGRAEKILNLALPDDFKEFIDVYGSGAVDGFLWVLNPFSENDNLNFSASEYMRDAYRHMKKAFPARYPRETYPSAGGILPWGISDNGDSVFWITDGTPNEWVVGVHDKSQSEELIYPVGMTSFLAGLMAGRIRPAIFPLSFPSEKPVFVSARK